MKKRIYICVYTILILLMSGLLFKYFYNEKQITAYDRGDYSVYFDVLKYVNFPQGYLPYYNNGNVYYQQKQYGKAADMYREALKRNAPHPKECSIRINLALAMLYGLGDDYASPEKRDESLTVLYEARELLLEENCATDEESGHSKEAQKLKDEIDQIIDELENPPPDPPPQSDSDDPNGGGSGQDQNDNQNNDNNDDNENQGGGSSSDEKDEEQQLMDELLERQEENYKEREEGMQSAGEMGDWSFNYDDEIW